MFFDQLRFFFMLRSIEFYKLSDKDVQARMKPILDEYWKSDNTESVWPVLKLMIMDPIDRKNANEWLGLEDAWLDKYKPKD